MFDKAIIQQITASLAAETGDPGEKNPVKSPFSQEDVEFLVETAFLASLKKEEDRPVTFSLVFLSKKRAAAFDDKSRKPLIMTFQQHIPLTDDALSKIAMAFDPRFTSFIVAPHMEDGKKRYEIWGAMFFTALPNYFDNIPSGFDADPYRRPDLFMITSVTPGSLILSRGDTQVGRFVGGKFIKATTSPFYPRAMGSFLNKKIKRDGVSRAKDPAYWEVFIHSLDYLLSEISSRSRGGAILIIPEQDLLLYSDYYSAKYAFHEDLKIHELIVASLGIDAQAGDADLQRLSYNRKISDRLQMIAQLAAADGALIMSGAFRPMLFGVTLKAPKWKGLVFEGPDGNNGVNAVFEHKLLGTRHNSMIDFIGKCPHSIGFVVSQDGPIRGLVRKNIKTMYCWPDCRVSLFV